MPAGNEQTKLKAIVRQFGLADIEIRPYSSYYKSNAAFRISSDQGEWMLKPVSKRFIKKRADQYMISFVKCIRQLEQSHYPYMPGWRITRSGQYWLIRDGTPYYMTEWVEGRHLRMEPADLAALGTALARLHSIREDSAEDRRNRSRKLFQHKLLQREERFRTHLPAACAVKNPAGRWFARYGSVCKVLSDEAREVLERPEAAEILAEEASKPAFIHGDITVPNVVFSQAGVKLIDWDSVKIGSAYMEIAKTLANATGFSPSLMHAFMQGYEGIKPFRTEERLIVSGLFRFPREAWYSAKALVNGTHHPVFNIMKRSWTKRLDAVNWIDRWASDGLEQLQNGQETPSVGMEIADQLL